MGHQKILGVTATGLVYYASRGRGHRWPPLRERSFPSQYPVPLPNTPSPIRLHAPAKLNLTLEVLGKRDDGFHALRTVMCAIRLSDTLELFPACEGEGIRLLSVSGPMSDGTPLDGSNLVARALEELQRETGCGQGADVRLHKRIPSQAGLGGGSSDAAAALVGANLLWGLELATEELAKIGGRLGSDIPFFVHVIASRYAPRGDGGAQKKDGNKCVKPHTNSQRLKTGHKKAKNTAICTGKGENVTLYPSVGGLACVVVKPLFGLSTPLVFQKWAENGYHSGSSQQASSGCCEGGHAANVVASLANGDWQRLQPNMGNVLQAPAMQLEPRLEMLKYLFTRLPVLAHQLSGSGSAYFGLCGSWREAHRVAAMLRAQRVGDVFVTATW